MNRNLMIGGISALVLVVAAGWYLMNQSSSTNSSPTPIPQSQILPTEIPARTNEGTSSGTTGTKEFTVTGSGFKFSPSTLTVNKGDKVKITFVNSGGTHNFILDQFGVKTKTLGTGQQETVEFTADKAGSFEYYCSVANHKAMGMKGMLVVK